MYDLSQICNVKMRFLQMKQILNFSWSPKTLSRVNAGLQVVVLNFYIAMIQILCQLKLRKCEERNPK